MNDRLWDTAALGVVAAVVVAHVSFLMADGRIPQDPGLYYRDLPELHAAWLALDFETLIAGAVKSSGWYNVMIGLFLAVFGINPLNFSLFDVVWVGLILLSVVVVLRKLHSPAAALSGVCLVGAMPVVFLVGRTGWIHTPESALVLMTLATWCLDRGLSKRRTVFGVALLGALAIALRPSGAVWVATLIPLVLLGRPAWGRVVAVGAAWLVALLVPLSNAEKYLAAKGTARDRYTSQLPDLIEQVASNIGSLTIAVVGLGLLAGVVSMLRRRPRAVDPVVVLMLAWTGLSLLLWSLFQAGLDNFPLIAPALSILAGLGLARLAKPLSLLSLPVFLLFYIPQWVPTSSLAHLHRLPGAGFYIYGGDIRNHYRVYHQYGWLDVKALLTATCPDRTCTVAIDQGLLEPFTEDIGELEMFLVQADNIELLSIRDRRLSRDLSVDALVEYNCGAEKDQMWRERFPMSIENLVLVMEGLSMRPVWSRPVSGGCEVLWMTPGGTLEQPESAPTTGVLIHDAPEPSQQDADLMPEHLQRPQRLPGGAIRGGGSR